MLIYNNLIKFKPIVMNGKNEVPIFDARSSIEIIKRCSSTKVSFVRAYQGWRYSGAKNEAQVGPGKSFLRWLNHHQLSIDWAENDFEIHPVLSGPNAPRHSSNDEYAKDHTFAIRSVLVNGRAIKLYITDQHMLRLFCLKHGAPVDFLELVASYISHRLVWEKWKMPSPFFLDWMISHQKIPIFRQGQVGICLPFDTTQDRV